MASASAQPREVLVYLANEPSPTESETGNIARITTWLRNSPKATDQILADAILEDLRTFPAVVDADIRAISRSADRLAGVVIASNRLLQSGEVLINRKGGLTPLPLNILPANDSREASNPLSNARNVGLVLDLVAAQFSPAEYEFVVVVSSHGDEEYALTPRLGLPTDGLTQDSLLARVHGADSAFVERYGITTASLLALLAAKRADLGLRTSLLVLDSCRSTIDHLPPEIPQALVAAGGQSLPFGIINYEWILNSTEPSLREAFVSALTPTPFEVADPAVVTRRRWQTRRNEVAGVAVYFVPLILWLLGFAWLRRRRARTTLP